MSKPTKTIKDVLKYLALYDINEDFMPAVDQALQDIKSIIESAIETPTGHIPDEECCELCDLRNEIRTNLNKLLESEK